MESLEYSAGNESHFGSLDSGANMKADTMHPRIGLQEKRNRTTMNSILGFMMSRSFLYKTTRHVRVLMGCKFPVREPMLPQKYNYERVERVENIVCQMMPQWVEAPEGIVACMRNPGDGMPITQMKLHKC